MHFFFALQRCPRKSAVARPPLLAGGAPASRRKHRQTGRPGGSGSAGCAPRARRGRGRAVESAAGKRTPAHLQASAQHAAHPHALSPRARTVAWAPLIAAIRGRGAWVGRRRVGWRQGARGALECVCAHSARDAARGAQSRVCLVGRAAERGRRRGALLCGGGLRWVGRLVERARVALWEQAHASKMAARLPWRPSRVFRQRGWGNRAPKKSTSSTKGPRPRARASRFGRSAGSHATRFEPRSIRQMASELSSVLAGRAGAGSGRTRKCWVVVEWAWPRFWRLGGGAGQLGKLFLAGSQKQGLGAFFSRTHKPAAPPFSVRLLAI